MTGLLLMRAEAREREIAVRMALGSGTARLLLQSLLEALMLATAGAILGIPFAWGALQMIASIATLPTDLPFSIAARIDGRALMLTLGVTLAVAVGCGWTPWIAARRFTIASGLKSGGHRGAITTRSVLVTGAIALASMLVATGGLLSRIYGARAKLTWDIGPITCLS